MLDGPGNLAAGGDSFSGGDQPLVQFGQHGLGVLLAQLQTIRYLHVTAIGFNRIQQADTAQRLGGDRAALILVHLKEITAYMDQTSQFRHAIGEELFVAGKIVDHEGPLPAFEESSRVRTGATSGL